VGKPSSSQGSDLFKPLLGVLLIATVVYVASTAWRERPATIEELLEQALNGPTLDQRVGATVELSNRGPEALEALRRIAAESDESDVLAACLGGLAGQWDYESMDTFFAMLESESRKVRGRAAQAVMRMTGRQRPYAASGPDANRSLVAQHLRADWETISRAPAEHRAELIRRLKESHGEPTDGD